MAIFTNQAQLSYKNTIVNSNIATGEVVEVLTATKPTVTEDYSVNDEITYVISIVNSGNTPFNGLTITDNLGGYEFDNETLYPLTYVEDSAGAYINGVPSAAAPEVTAETGELVITGINVPANGNYILIYQTAVTNYAPLGEGASLINTATISGGGLSTPLTPTAEVAAELGPNLTILKSVEPTTVNENGTLTYTFVIQNYGNAPAEADDNVSLTDTFLPVLTNVTVSLPADSYEYNEETGVFATIPGRLTVPAATFAQDPDTGVWSATPGVTSFTVSGTV